MLKIRKEREAIQELMKTKTLKSSKYRFADCGDWIGNNTQGLIKTTKAASALKSTMYKTKARPAERWRFYRMFLWILLSLKSVFI